MARTKRGAQREAQELRREVADLRPVATATAAFVDALWELIEQRVRQAAREEAEEVASDLQVSL